MHLGFPLSLSNGYNAKGIPWKPDNKKMTIEEPIQQTGLTT